MKRDIVLIVIIVAVLCIGVINTVNAVEMETFVGNEYTIDVPADWEYYLGHPSECEYTEWELFAEDMNVPCGDLKGCYISQCDVAKDPRYSDASSLDELATIKLLRNAQRVDTNYWTTINSERVWVMESHRIFRNSEYEIHSHHFQFDETVYYIIDCNALKGEEFDEYNRLYFEPMVQSFKLKRIPALTPTPTPQPTPTPTPAPTPEPKEPLKLIRDTLELTEGKSKSYTVNSNGGSLIVKANGLDEMFLIKNKYTIEILKDGEPFETYNMEFSTLEPVGDPAKVEIVLPLEPAQYTVTVTCDNIGNFLWWSNGENAQIIVFSSLHTTKSAKAMKLIYSELAAGWDSGGTEAVKFFITSAVGDPTTFEGVAKLFLPESASVFLTSLEIISTDYDSIMEKLAAETLYWGTAIQPKFHETSVYPDRVYEIRDELKAFYAEIGYNMGYSWFKFNPESYISTQLRAMAYLNSKTQGALREERFEDAKFFMEAQKDFTSHLDWLILAEEVPTRMDHIINDKGHSYYELWKLSRSLVECDIDRIRNYFSERASSQQTG